MRNLGKLAKPQVLSVSCLTFYIPEMSDKRTFYYKCCEQIKVVLQKKIIFFKKNHTTADFDSIKFGIHF